MNQFESCMTDGGFTLVKKRTKYIKKQQHPKKSNNKSNEFKYKQINEKSDKLAYQNIIDSVNSKKSILLKSKFIEELYDLECMPHIYEANSIVCLGLGSLSSIKSQYQLALLLIFIDKMGLYDIIIYDPIFNDDDINVLNHFNLKIDENNLDGMYNISKKCFFYMPHCEKFLYNNLLKSNWDNNLHHIIIFGNSFSMMIDHANNNNQDNVEYILKSKCKFKEFPIPKYKNDDIFNNSSIHIFQN